MTQQTAPVRFVYAIYIETTPDKLWQALTDGAFTQRYWGRWRVQSDWKVGSKVEFWVDEDNTLEHGGTVLEYDPPRRLVMTFKSETDPNQKDDPPSRVTYVIEQAGSAVKLIVIHDELDPHGAVPEALSNGWAAILSSLKTMLETGEPMRMSAIRWRPPRNRDRSPRQRHHRGVASPPSTITVSTSPAPARRNAAARSYSSDVKQATPCSSVGNSITTKRWNLSGPSMIWNLPPRARTLPPCLAMMPGTRSVYFLYSTGSLIFERATQ